MKRYNITIEDPKDDFMKSRGQRHDIRFESVNYRNANVITLSDEELFDLLNAVMHRIVERGLHVQG